MVLTYDGLTVPQQIHSSLIISAFANCIDEESLDYYREKDLSQVDDIIGYPHIVTEDEIGEIFISGEEVSEEHIGLLVWYVTDGHHRATVACEQGLNLSVKLDYSAITLEEELAKYNELYAD